MTTDERVALLRETGFCEAMLDADGTDGIAERLQCWQRRLKRENWCDSCRERTDALDALAAELKQAREALVEIRNALGPETVLRPIDGPEGLIAEAYEALRIARDFLERP